MQVCSADRCNQGRKPCPCPDKCRDESDPLTWLEDTKPAGKVESIGLKVILFLLFVWAIVVITPQEFWK